MDERLKNYFLGGAYKSILIQIGLTALAFVTALLIARLTGDKGFGIYSIVFSWVMVFAVTATIGLDDLVLKELSIYKEQNNQEKINGIIIWTNLIGVASGVIFMFLLLFLSNLLTEGLTEYYYYAILAVPFFVLIHINQAILRAVGDLAKGQIAEKTILPLSFFIILLGSFFILDHISDLNVILYRTIAFLIACLFALFFVGNRFRQAMHLKVVAFEHRKWFSLALVFAITSFFIIINSRIDIVLLSVFKIPESQIGYYNAAVKIADIAMLPYIVLYTVTTPVYAKLKHINDRCQLQTFFTRTTLFSFVMVSLFVFFLIASGNYLLCIFGDNFTSAYSVLILLSFSKLVHVFFGPTNYLLMMSGVEKEALGALAFSVFLSLLMFYTMIPIMGILGAAWSILVGVVIFEIILAYFTIKKLGIYPTIIGGFLSKNKK